MGHQLLCNQWVLCGAFSQLSLCLSFKRASIHDESVKASKQIILASKAASQAGTT